MPPSPMLGSLLAEGIEGAERNGCAISLLWVRTREDDNDFLEATFSSLTESKLSRAFLGRAEKGPDDLPSITLFPIGWPKWNDFLSFISSFSTRNK